MKKKTMQGAGMGYCPVSSLGHDTMGLYRDTAGMGAQPGPRYGRLWATTQSARGHDTASWAAIRQACALGKRRASAHGLVVGECVAIQ